VFYGPSGENYSTPSGANYERYLEGEAYSNFLTTPQYLTDRQVRPTGIAASGDRIRVIANAVSLTGDDSHMILIKSDDAGITWSQSQLTEPDAEWTGDMWWNPDTGDGATPDGVLTATFHS